MHKSLNRKQRRKKSSNHLKTFRNTFEVHQKGMLGSQNFLCYLTPNLIRHLKMQKTLIWSKMEHNSTFQLTKQKDRKNPKA